MAKNTEEYKVKPVKLGDTPQEEMETTATPTATAPAAPQTSADMYSTIGTSIAEDVKRQEEAVAAREAQTATRRQRLEEAQRNRTSILGAIMEEHKPKYDADKERRLRNRAIVQSLGDMLSAAVVGVNAFGKRGAGHVTPLSGESALASLNEINRMREEYRQRGEEWRDLELKYKSALADEEVAAAQALLTKEEAELARDKASLEAARGQARNYDMAMAQQKAYEEERERAREHAIYMETLRQQGDLGAGQRDKAEMADDIAVKTIAEMVLGGAAYGKDVKTTTERKTREKIGADGLKVIEEYDAPTTVETQRDWVSLTADQRAAQIQEWRSNKDVRKAKEHYDSLISAGYAPEVAMSIIQRAWHIDPNPNNWEL